jgi:primosomal protein N' (replication factor Y)
MKYVGVVIETKSDSVDKLFTYKTDIDDIKIGTKVRVFFAGQGERAKKVGYVFEVSDELPKGLEGVTIRSIGEVIPETSLCPDTIGICLWMRERYFCRYIDAANCFAPFGKPSKTGKKRVPDKDGATKDEQRPYLTNEQKRAVSVIEPSVKKKEYQTFLVEGVTGSGKTEVYLNICEQVVGSGRQVIMLVPEISLTHQTVERTISRFGHERVAILHSKLTAGERYDEWIRIKKGEVDIVIGARSAIFAPFDNIGAIILDEEHEATYKSEQIPKYDAVEVAIKRASAGNAICVLGSATPSIISRYRAQSGLYEHVVLTKRFNTTPLPSIEVVDMRKEMLKGNLGIFSESLFGKMNASLASRKQVMLFLNRRGYSNFVSCRSCGYVMKCPTCGISLTYHKKENKAICHFCGKGFDIPDICPSCGKEKLRLFGVGTEQLEELTKKAFPEMEIARMDVDTTSKKGSGQKILKDFAKGKIDILIGTQMIAKGLDFAGVNLVGIIAADVSLNIPDFRSPERTFQLITQVAGRAGRRDEQGDVVVQTFVPDNYAIEAAKTHDFEGFYNAELFIRKQLNYPPMSDILRIVIFAEKEAVAAGAANDIRDYLTRITEAEEHGRILGPKAAYVAKIDGDYRYQIYIKARTAKRKFYQKILSELKRKINNDNSLEYRIIVDVNPYSLT